MLRTRGRIIDVTSLADLDRRLDAGAKRLTGWRISGVDLRERGARLASCETRRTTFVGCRFAPGDEERMRASGAQVLPAIADRPIDPQRSRLYSPDDLYDAAPYADSFDARTYSWSQTSRDPESLLARVLHDQAIDTALNAWRAGRRLVGVMGGHAAARNDPLFADAARLGHQLGQSHIVATGGGPGAMEAANLGARLAAGSDADLQSAIGDLARIPSFRPSIDAWVDCARDVVAAYDGPNGPTANLGVPTWHYGHEPPNIFATTIAKYFRNAVREAILLEICDAGIVFLPGAGGTVQEIFQDACENYYAAEASVAPMVLVGRTYWTETLPAWPLLKALATGRSMESRIHLVDGVEEAAQLLS